MNKELEKVYVCHLGHANFLKWARTKGDIRKINQDTVVIGDTKYCYVVDNLVLRGVIPKKIIISTNLERRSDYLEIMELVNVLKHLYPDCIVEYTND